MPPTEPTHILLVEDSAVDVQDIRRKLAFLPHQVQVVQEKTLAGALGRLDKAPCDLVILDLNLPDSSGLNSLKSLVSRFPDLPVVVLTGQGDEETALEALSHGAQDYLFKDQIDRHTLRRAISYSVERKGCEKRLLRSEARYRELFKSMPSGVVYQSADGRITMANPAAQKILGRSLEEMQGKTSEDPGWQPIHADGTPCAVDEHPSMQALRTGREVRNVVMGVFNPREKAYRWISIDAVPQFRPGERHPNQVYTTFDDITERKQAEDRLRDQDTFLREIHKVSAIGGFERNPDTGEGRWTEGMYAILGYEPGAIAPTHESFMDHVHPDDRESFERAMQECRDLCRDFEQQFRIRCKGGEVRHVRAAYAWVCDTQGTPCKYIGALRDITPEVQAFSQLEASEERYRRIVDTSLEGVWWLDAEGNTVFVNERMEELLGYSHKELMQRGLFDYLDARSVLDRYEFLRKLHMGLRVTEDLVFKRSDGKPLWTIAAFNPVIGKKGEVTGALCMLTDITKRKQAEDKLKNREDRLRSIIESTNVGFGEVDAQGRILLVNSAAASLLNYVPDELVGTRYQDHVHPEERDEARERVAGLFKGEESGYRIEQRYLTKHGQVKWLDMHVTPLKGPDGSIVSVLGAYVDVTAQKRAVQELQESQSLLAEAERLAHVGAWQWDIEKDQWTFSDNWKQLHGIDKATLSSEELLQIALPEDRDRIIKAFDNARKTGKAYEIEHRIIRQDTGEVRWIRAYGEVVDEKEDVSARVIGAAQDITEQKRAETALKESTELFAKAFENDLVAVAISRQSDGTYIEANPGFLRVTGYSAQEVIGKTSQELGFLNAEQRHELTSLIKTHGEARNQELTFRTKKGAQRTIMFDIGPLVLRGEACFIATMVDITDRKEMELKLAQKEEEFRTLTENSTDLIARFDLNLRHLYVNPTICNIAGLTLEKYLGRTNRELGFEGELVDLWDQAVEGVIATGEPRTIEFEYASPEGAKAILSRLIPEKNEQGDVQTVLSLGTDITVQKQAERSLRESEERFRSLIEDVPNLAVQGYRADRTIFFWNKASEDLYGYTVDEAMGRKLEETIIPEPLRNEAVRLMQNWLNKDERIPAGELELLRKDGSMVPVYSSHVMLTNARGEKEMYCIDVDLRQLKEAEQALRESEEQFSKLFEEAGESMFVHDLEGRFLLVNAQAQKSLGYAREELCTLGVEDVDPGSVYKQDRQKLWRNLSGKERLVFEAEHKRKDGTIFPVEVSLRSLNYQGQRVILATAHDLEERKVAERALKESEEKYRALFDNAQAGIFQIRIEDGIILTCNQRYAEIYGAKDSETMVGKSIVEFYENPDDRMYILKELRSAAPKPVSYILRMKKADGEPIYISASVTFLENGAVVEGVITDVTERMEARLELEKRTQELNEANTALRVLLKQASQAREELESKIMANVEGLLMPHVNALEQAVSSDADRGRLETVKADLAKLTSGFAKELQRNGTQLTPRELQVADLIRQGKTSKEIAALLHLSTKAISFHRSNIRKKLGLKNRKVNLRAHLQSIS